MNIELKEVGAYSSTIGEENGILNNIFRFIVKNRARVIEDEIIMPIYRDGKIEKINFKKDIFLLKFVEIAEKGVDLRNCTVTPFRTKFGDYEPTVIVDYKHEKYINLVLNGLRGECIHIRKGDEFQELSYLRHVWKTQPIVNHAVKLDSAKKVINDILFYGYAVYNAENQMIGSYFESTENIRLAAAPASSMFYNAVNSYNEMHEKFVFRKLIKKLNENGIIKCSNFIDFEVIENFESFSEIDEKKQKKQEKQEKFIAECVTDEVAADVPTSVSDDVSKLKKELTDEQVLKIQEMFLNGNLSEERIKNSYKLTENQTIAIFGNTSQKSNEI